MSIDAGIVSGLDVYSSTDTTVTTRTVDTSTGATDQPVNETVTTTTEHEFGHFRGGRQKVASATVNELASVARIKYTGVPGLELAGSVFYQNDLVQNEDYAHSGLLTSFHAVYKQDTGFGFRALYAQWDVEGDDVPDDAEKQSGFYIEPSYKWNIENTPYSVGVYARYSDLEYYKKEGVDKTFTEYGISFYPAKRVVFKADLVAEKDGDDTINLGVGYQF